MLPENDPNRIVMPHRVNCFKCSTVIPPGVALYDVRGRACCGECYQKSQMMHSTQVGSMQELEWPEEIEI